MNYLLELQKTLHLSQNVILIGTSCYFIGIWINKFLPKIDIHKNRVTIFIEAITQALLVVLLVFYLHIFYQRVPLLFKILTNYNSHNKSVVLGESLAYSLILFSTQTKIKDKFRILSENVCNRRNIFREQCDGK
jgi:hypothetical protein